MFHLLHSHQSNLPHLLYLGLGFAIGVVFANPVKLLILTVLGN